MGRLCLWLAACEGHERAEPDEAFRVMNVEASTADLAIWTVMEGEDTVTLSGALDARRTARLLMRQMALQPSSGSRLAMSTRRTAILPFLAYLWLATGRNLSWGSAPSSPLLDP